MLAKGLNSVTTVHCESLSLSSPQKRQKRATALPSDPQTTWKESMKAHNQSNRYNSLMFHLDYLRTAQPLNRIHPFLKSVFCHSHAGAVPDL